MQLQSLPPNPAYITDAYITRIIDADTIEIEIIKKAHVRLKNINAPEKNTIEGQKAISFLKEFLQKHTNYWSKPVRISIPLNNSLKVMDFNSFERIIADVWVNNQNLSQIMLDNKMAVSYAK